jgi:hypothetical protein
MSEHGACLQQQELIEAVRIHLLRISELTRDVAAALAAKDEDLATKLDKEVDLELGLKERAMGALHQHRKEHCC